MGNNMLKISRSETKKFTRLRSDEKSSGCCPEEQVGGGGLTLYSGDSVVGTQRVATLTDSLHIQSDPDTLEGTNFILAGTVTGFPATEINGLRVNDGTTASDIGSTIAILNDFAGFTHTVGMISSPQDSSNFNINISASGNEATGQAFNYNSAISRGGDLTGGALNILQAENATGSGGAETRIFATVGDNGTGDAVITQKALNTNPASTDSVIWEAYAEINNSSALIVQAILGVRDVTAGWYRNILLSEDDITVGDVLAGTDWKLPWARNGSDDQVLTFTALGVGSFDSVQNVLGGTQPALTAPDATATDGTIGTNDTITDNIRTRLNELESRLQTLGLLS